MIRSFKNKRGQALAEYGLILAIIGVAVLGALNLAGGKVSKAIGDGASAIETNGIKLKNTLTK